MSRRIEVVTVTKQTVLNGKVVAAVTTSVKRIVTTRKDGSEFVVLDGKRCELIKGLVLVIN